jgi:hypothetical protein
VAVKKDLEDEAKEPRFNLAVFLRNAYKHPDFSDEIDNTPDVEAANKSPTIEDNLSEASSSQPEIPNNNQLSGEESTSTPQEATLEDQSTLKNDDTKSVLDEQNAVYNCQLIQYPVCLDVIPFLFPPILTASYMMRQDNLL